MRAARVPGGGMEGFRPARRAHRRNDESSRIDVNRTKKLTATTRLRRAVPAVLAVAVVGCSQQDPTSVDTTLLPEQPVTVEMSFPWTDFGSNVTYYGGYGSAAQTGTGYVANDFENKLTARTLVRFGAYPTSATVIDTLGNQTTDYDISFHGGRVVAFFDTLGSVVTKPVTLSLAVLTSDWDARTATWTWAVDTVGDMVPWDQPGAGPATFLTTTVWDPSSGDSAVFQLDSAQAVTWQDSLVGNASMVGARLSALTPGARLKVSDVALRLDTKSSLQPDTSLVLSDDRTDLTFVYTPPPNAPTDGIRTGGVPAWRTVLDLNLPRTLNGPAALCAVVQCPMTLTANEITYAALVLHTKTSDPAYAPSDSVYLDARPVFDRSLLPKAPLGASIITSGVGRRLPAALFGAADQGSTVEIPITTWMQAVVADTTNLAPRAVALLATYEPYALTYASFYGPGSPLAPTLRLIVSVGPPVEHP